MWVKTKDNGKKTLEHIESEEDIWYFKCWKRNCRGHTEDQRNWGKQIANYLTSFIKWLANKDLEDIAKRQILLRATELRECND